MALENLNDLYVEQLRDLYSAENQLIDALPKMAEAASHPELRSAFQAHFKQTQEHVRRLEEIAHRLGISPSGKTCKGMKGLIEEGKEILNERADPSARDAGLIAAAQRVEHYEIAGYGCVRTYAKALGRSQDADQLQQTLDVEADTDKKLTRIAEQVVNPDAQHQARGASTQRTTSAPNEARS